MIKNSLSLIKAREKAKYLSKRWRCPIAVVQLDISWPIVGGGYSIHSFFAEENVKIGSSFKTPGNISSYYDKVVEIIDTSQTVMPWENNR